MRFRKIIAVIIAFIMIACAMPLSSFAFEYDNGGETELKRVSSAVELSHALHETAEKYGPEFTRDGELSEEFAMSRLIVFGGTNLETKGAVSHIYGYNKWHFIQYKTPEDAKAAMSGIKAQQGVKAVSQDFIIQLPEEEACQAEPTRAEGPNDFLSWGWRPAYANAYDYQQWLLEQYGGDVSALPEIVVAVIDTGCDLDHDWLEDRLVPGYDFLFDDDEPQDENGHGTHVAGTVVDGTLENVKIMPIRFMTKRGRGLSSDAVASLEYAREQGCKVANMSFCFSVPGEGDLVFSPLVNQCTNEGMVCVAAAGNKHDDAAYYSPAGIQRALTVAAHTMTGALASFSNVGDAVDIAAAGSGVTSSFLGGGTNGSLYYAMSGTSMAAPHAAAAAALVFSAYPDMDADSVMESLKLSAKGMDNQGGGSGNLDLTDLFVYDSYMNVSQSSMHFISKSETPWTVNGDGEAMSGEGLGSGEKSILTGRGRFISYQEVTFEYRLTGLSSGDRFTVRVGDETRLAASGDTDGWQAVTLLVPPFDGTQTCKGFLSIEWEFLNASGGAGHAEIRNVVRHDTVSSVISGNNTVNLYFQNVPGTAPWTQDGTYAYSGNTAGYESGCSEITAFAELYRKARFAFYYSVNVNEGDRFELLVNGEPVLSVTEDVGYDYFRYSTPAAGEYTFTFRFTGTGRAFIGAAPDGEVEQVFNEDQVAKLRAFLETEDANGVKNGEKISEDYSPNNPGTWGVQWGIYNGFYYRVYRISWGDKGLVGDLDLSGFRQLYQLFLGNNKITSLNIDGCGSLTWLDMRRNEMTSLEIGSDDFPFLGYVDISENKLEGTLDLGGFLSLSQIVCSNNRLTGLSVDECLYLNYLDCSGNDLTFLDLTNCRRLAHLGCSDNDLVSLDLSDCRVLTDLYCHNNKLTSLDVGGNRMIRQIYASNNKLALLNVEGCEALRELNCPNNDLTELDLSGLTMLETVSCDYNSKLRTLNASGCSALSTLWLGSDVLLTSLNVSGCSSLKELNCRSSSLTDLDLSGLTVLETVDCGYGSLRTLNASGCSALTELRCCSNPLMNMDISGCSSLRVLDCWGNLLTELDLTGLPELEEVNCSSSNLTQLNVTGLTSLRKLNCSSTKLTSLDVSTLSSLKELNCGWTEIETLDVSGLTGLENVDLPKLTSFSAEGTALCTKNVTAFGGRFSGAITPQGVTFYVDWQAGFWTRGWYDAEGELVSTGMLQVGADEASEAYTLVYIERAQAPESIAVEPITVPVDITAPVSLSFEPITANDTTVWFECLQPNIAVVESETFWNGNYDEKIWFVRGVSKGRTTIIAHCSLDDTVGRGHGRDPLLHQRRSAHRLRGQVRAAELGGASRRVFRRAPHVQCGRSRDSLRR